MIEAILFDFDGVIRQWDESDLWTFETEANIERGTVFAVAFSKELHAPLTRGELTWAQWKDETERIGSLDLGRDLHNGHHCDLTICNMGTITRTFEPQIQKTSKDLLC